MTISWLEHGYVYCISKGGAKTFQEEKIGREWVKIYCVKYSSYILSKIILKEKWNGRIKKENW